MLSCEVPEDIFKVTEFSPKTTFGPVCLLTLSHHSSGYVM